ncbi:MAG: DinB family protein [Planctomycetota bacterium]
MPRTRAGKQLSTALLSIDPTTKRPAWHGAPTYLGLMRGVTPQHALFRPAPGMNCIREIALHIAFWENSVANRLAGTSHRLPFAQRKTGTPQPVSVLPPAQWKQEVSLMVTAHERLVDAVRTLAPERLDQPADPRTGRIASEMIHGVAEHTLYHTGQIKMLKKLAKAASR